MYCNTWYMVITKKLHCTQILHSNNTEIHNFDYYYITQLMSYYCPPAKNH